MSDAKPFLKWAGGKRKLVPELLCHAPDKIGTYHEPFLGGGALFFELANQERFSGAILSDVNGELVTTYQVVRDQVDELIELLREFKNDESEFYERRSQAPIAPVEVAARMIYLSRTCFNGLYRVNKKGKFNAPFGKYKNPKICDPDGLRAASLALQPARIVCCGFSESMQRATEGDFVYLDPPYVPASTTANFAQYHKSSFGPAEHSALLNEFRRLRSRHVAALLSNSDTEETRHLYERCSLRTIQAARSINSAGSKRGPVGELLVFDAWDCTVGSLVLHIDSKVAADVEWHLKQILGPCASRIVWRYRRWPAKTKNFQRVHDVLLRWSRKSAPWNQLYEPLAPSTLKKFGKTRQSAQFVDGKRTGSLRTDEESPGTPMGDVWDIPIIAPRAFERTGYPTQKPLALLDRLVLSCTEPGGIVCDLMMGSGTALESALVHGRNAIGFDRSMVAVRTAEKRLARFLEAA